MFKKSFLVSCFIVCVVVASTVFCTRPQKTSDWTPKRINKCIELLEAGQPIYYKSAYGGYDKGLEMARTWADYIVYNMEHNPIDFTLLREFMRGLVDGGPTKSGHRTPTVIAIVPGLGVDVPTFKGGSWMVQQALAQGVHGVHLCKARDPEQSGSSSRTPGIRFMNRLWTNWELVSGGGEATSLRRGSGGFPGKNTWKRPMCGH